MVVVDLVVQGMLSLADLGLINGLDLEPKWTPISFCLVIQRAS